MTDVLQTQDDSLATQRADARARGARLSRSYKCRCGNHVFFDNTLCLACDARLGFLPDEGRVAALDPGTVPGTWMTPGRDDVLKFCGNRNVSAACNWMMYAKNPHALCVACRLNRTVPDPDVPGNALYWSKVESAKRRLVSQLITLGLPVRSRIHDDPEHGLMFDFLRSPPNGPQVMTGHANGLITINVEEADDAKREKIRHAMR